MRSRFLSLQRWMLQLLFLNLESRVAQQRQMPCLKLPDGRVTSNVLEMRNHAVDFTLIFMLQRAVDNDCMTTTFSRSSSVGL